MMGLKQHGPKRGHNSRVAPSIDYARSNARYSPQPNGTVLKNRPATMAHAEKLKSLKVSLPNSLRDSGDDTREKVERNYLYSYSYSNNEWDNWSIGSYCLLEGTPCRVTRVHHCRTGKHGHRKHFVEGYGIFENLQCEVFGPNNPPEIPKFVDVKKVPPGAVEQFSSLLPQVSWVDNEYRPCSRDQFVITAVLLGEEDDEAALKIIRWCIPMNYRRSPSSLAYLVRERDAFQRREKIKKEFYTFLAAVKRAQEESSAILGMLAGSQGILHLVLNYMCGPPKYRKGFAWRRHSSGSVCIELLRELPEKWSVPAIDGSCPIT